MLEAFQYSTPLLFASDMKFYLPIRNTTDCIKLQSDIKRAINWCIIIKFEFNLSKCCVMSMN